MAEIIQATLQAGAEIITANLISGSEEMTATVYVAATGPTGPPGPQGPEGPPGTGSTSFAELTDKTTADIPTINTPLATALALKAPLASPTFTGVVTAPRIKGKCDGLELECKAGQAITAGQVVYVTGASGTNVIVGLARADSEVTSSKTIGVSESTLALNGIGYVITEGLMDVDLTVASTVTVGDPIWLSGTTAGGMLFGITNKPLYPYHQVYLGVVTRKTGTTKVTEIYVKVQNGLEISELSDVSIVDPMEGQALMRNATKWTNRDIVSADISDATTGPTPSTLALRDTLGDLHAVDLYCDGVSTGTVEDGNLYLYDSTVGDYSSIKTNAGSFYLYPPPISLKGTVVINPTTSTVNSNLTFQNTSLETYTFPTSGGTLLANTGNLVGLTSPSVARTSLQLGDANSPTFQGLTLTSASLTANTPNSFTQTWNAVGTTFTAVKVNALGNATSSALSLLLDLQLDSVSKAKINKAGGLDLIHQFGSLKLESTDYQQYNTIGNRQLLLGGNGNGLSLWSTYAVGWSSSTTDAYQSKDLFLTRKAAASLRLGAADAAASSAVVTATNGSDLINWASHGLTTGCAVSFSNSGGTLFGGLTANRLYYVVVNTTGTFKLAATYADAIATSPTVIDITSDGSGTNTAKAATIYQSLNVQNYTGTDIVGSPFVINSSQGTGLGAGGPIVFRTAPAGGTTGATQNALSSTVTIENDGSIVAKVRLQGTAPSSATATGTAGDIRYDASYVYICTATNTWVRAALTTWP